DDVFRSLKDFKGLGVFNQYDRDVSMIRQMYDLGNRLGRKTVLEPSLAYILYEFTGIKTKICQIEGSVTPEYCKQMEKDWEIISVDEIRKAPERYLLQNSYRNIMSLTDFDGIEGKYFHLFGEPLVEGQKAWKIMRNVLDKLSWQFFSYSNLYSFSHAYPNQLAYLVKQIDAKSVVAVHSKDPDRPNPGDSIQIFPEEGKDYILKNGELRLLDK
ncbi:MAG: hypothetical protein IKF80_01330, partial [Erysipelotrichaceae bacterium]|nr:hypothetical protein [Erysipelotrichaceae bacterium]